MASYCELNDSITNRFTEECLLLQVFSSDRRKRIKQGASDPVREKEEY